MKILLVTATLDLSKPFTGTPFLIQLFKGFHDEGHELFIIPYTGKDIQSFWWHAYPNPNYLKSVIMEKILMKQKLSYKKRKIPYISTLARTLANPSLKSLIKKVLTEQKEIDAVIFIGVPLNQINGIPSSIKQVLDIPVFYYDLDFPASLPSIQRSQGSLFNDYQGADLAEFDGFLVLAESGFDELKELGARIVHTVHVGVDPDICAPMTLEKDIDFFFLGTEGKERSNNIKMMVTEPSKSLSLKKFVMSGRKLEIDKGNAILIPMLTFPDWRRYCNRSKINLNIVREIFEKSESSTARPFELASMGCCVVSCPYKGLGRWFDLKKEMFMVNSSKEAIELYDMLLNDDELRLRIGEAARNRVIKEHTARHRARQIIEIIKFTH